MSLNSSQPSPAKQITVDQYHEMARFGILTEDDRVELLEGWIVGKAAHTPLHSGTLDLLEASLRGCVPEGWKVRSQRAVTTTDSEPEPDLIVVKGESRSFISRHPRPDEIGLVVEIAETSLASDQGIKARLYARAGIPVYWIINLVESQLELSTDPSGQNDAPGYGKREVFGPDDEVPLVLEGREVARIAVRELLP